MKRGNKHLGMIIGGIVLFGVGLYILVVEPAWVADMSIGNGLLSSGVVLAIIGMWNRRKRSEQVVDERVLTISYRAGYRTFQAVFVLLGLLTAVLGITGLDVKAYPVVSVLFAFTALAYMVAYILYRRRM